VFNEGREIVLASFCFSGGKLQAIFFILSLNY